MIMLMSESNKHYDAFFTAHNVLVPMGKGRPPYSLLILVKRKRTRQVGLMDMLSNAPLRLISRKVILFVSL